MRRHFYLGLGSVLLISLAIRIFLTIDRRFNMDEFEHLHSTWMIHKGFILYKDFWQNHTPLLYYLLLPLYSFFPEGTSLIFAARAILSASAFLILWLTYRLARTHNDSTTSILSVAILSCAVLFVQKTIEIRPDQFLVAFWLLSLLMVLRSVATNQSKVSILLAGVSLGIGMLFAPKAILCYAGMMLAFLLHWFRSKSSNSVLQLFRMPFFFTLGFIIPFAMCSILFYYLGTLHLFLSSTVFNNLNYPHVRAPMYLLSIQHLVFFVLSAAGIVIWLREDHTQKILFTCFLLTPGLSLFAIFLFLLPTSSPQSALLFVPILAIYAGIALRKSIDSSFLVFSLAILAGVIVPCVSLLLDQPSTVSNDNQLSLIRAVLRQTNPGDVFFDGSCSYVFRKQAHYYGSLPDGLIHAMRTGKIEENIAESLSKNQCKYVVEDDRLNRLSQETQIFIRDNYLPTVTSGLLLAGKELNPHTFSGRRVRFRINVPHRYKIHLNNSENFLIDGAAYGGPIFLSANSHEILSDTDLEYVVIRAATE